MSQNTGDFTNHVRLRQQIQEQGMDAAIALSAANLTYTSGFYNFDMTLLPFERLHATVTDASGQVTFVHPKREEPVHTFVEDEVIYNANEQQGIDVLVDVIQRRGLASSSIGIELHTAPAEIVIGLQQALPDVNWVAADHLFNEVRLIKTPAEVERLRQAAIATERGIMAAYALARPGDTEKQVVDLMGYGVTRNGGDFIAFNVFASGPRTTHGHHLAENVPLERGNIVRVDYGACFQGYYTDLVRMAVVGQPSERQRDIYRRVIELHREMIDLCRPGNTFKDLWDTTYASYNRLGMPLTRNMFGHSIGLSVHEPPIVDANGDRVIEPGMVLCIEHGWTDRDHAERYHSENMVLITDGEPDVLDKTTNIDEMFVIE